MAYMGNEGNEAGLPPMDGGVPVATSEQPRQGLLNRIKGLFGGGKKAEVAQTGSGMAEALGDQPATIDSGTPMPVADNLSASGSVGDTTANIGGSPEAVASSVEAQLGKATEINNPVGSFIPGAGAVPQSAGMAETPAAPGDPEPQPVA